MSCVCLLCGKVGVFSPSHRNHYLNVTPNNLLRIYPPDGVSLSSTQLPPLALVSDTPKNRKTRLHFAKNEICHLEMFYQAVNCPLKMLFLSPMMEHQGGDYELGFL